MYWFEATENGVWRWTHKKVSIGDIYLKKVDVVIFMGVSIAWKMFEACSLDYYFLLIGKVLFMTMFTNVRWSSENERGHRCDAPSTN